MSQMPPTSGWYDDPDDPTFLRYFDGVVWSERREPKAAPTVPTPDPFATIDPRTRQSQPVSPPPQSPPSWGQMPSAPPQHAPQQWPQAPAGAGWGGPTMHGRPLAGWWARVGAWLLDGLLFALPLLLVLTPLMWGWISDYWSVAVDAAEAGRTMTPADVPAPDASVLRVAVLHGLLYLVYDAVCTARWGRTIGKKIVGLRVLSADAPRHLDARGAALRAAVKHADAVIGWVPFLSSVASVFVLIDRLWPLWDKPLRQSLHDKVARSVVVRDR